MSNRAATGVLVLSLLMSGVAACGSSGGATDKDATAGSGGATAGSGGSDAGVGGADGGAAGSDAGADADGGDAASDAGAAGSDAGLGCVAITNAATPITDVSMPTVATPNGTGGVIVDGTYALTGLTKYMGNASANVTHSYTIKIAGTDLALSGHDGATADVNPRFTMTTDATSGAFMTSGYCPDKFVGLNLSGWSSYTAAGGVLHLFSTANHTEHVFTKQ